MNLQYAASLRISPSLPLYIFPNGRLDFSSSLDPKDWKKNIFKQSSFTIMFMLLEIYSDIITCFS